MSDRTWLDRVWGGQPSLRSSLPIVQSAHLHAWTSGLLVAFVILNRNIDDDLSGNLRVSLTGRRASNPPGITACVPCTPALRAHGETRPGRRVTPHHASAGPLGGGPEARDGPACTRRATGPAPCPDDSERSPPRSSRHRWRDR